MKTALTFYTDKLPEGVGGSANAFIVRIRPKYKDDKGIHRHEYEHVKQWYLVSAFAIGAIAFACNFLNCQMDIAIIGMAAHSILYLIVPQYRMWSEATAFAKQTKPDHSDLDTMARRLQQNYGLALTFEQSRFEIIKYL